MIQRIQSVYLFLAAMFAALATFFPLAHFSIGSGEIFELYASGLKVIGEGEVQGSIYMYIVAVASIILPLVTILLFNRRMVQIRACAVEVVLLIGFYAMIGAYFFLSSRALEGQGEFVRGIYPVLFAPLVSIVLSLLAAKSIFKDEILVRSADRIR